MNDKKIKSAVLQLISQKNYITYNKVLAKAIGLEATIVFGELSSVSNIFNTDEFYCLKEQIENDTCLSRRAVRIALKTLQEKGLISIVKKGIPCKNYYTLHIETLMTILSDVKNDTTRDNTDSDIKNNIYSDVKNDTASEIKNDIAFNKNIKENIKEKINITTSSDVDVIPEQTEKQETKKEYPQEAKDLTDFLYNDCKNNDTHFSRTQKQLENWTSEIEKLHRIDGRDWQEISAVLHWTRACDFWKPNIQSGAKFRKKYEMLYAQMQTDYKRKGKVFIKNDVYTGDDW